MYAYAPAAQEMASAGWVWWDHVCPSRHDVNTKAVIASVPQGAWRSPKPLAHGWPYVHSIRPFGAGAAGQGGP